MLTTFALRTEDADWIERNNATRDEQTQRVSVQVPAGDVEHVKFAGRDWLRHHFADAPADAANPWLMCPAEWVGGQS